MVEITDTRTKQPKLTLSSTGRVALKFHHQLSEQERAPYIGYAEAIAEQIGVPKFTIRGKFQDQIIRLRTRKKSFCFVLSELGAPNE